MPDYFRPAIAAMAGYVPGEQPQGRPFVKLNTNENPYPPSPRVAEALRQVDAARLGRYPDPLATRVRAAVAQVFGVPLDWTFAGNGSDDVLTIVTRCFVGETGCLATPDPSYSLYPVLAEIQGARTLAIPLADDFSLPADCAARAAGASLLFLARPNAPTGGAYPLDQVRQLCRAFPGVVLIDEAYADFADDHCLGLVRDCPNVIVSRTLSKSYSLAGVRLGIALAQPPLIAGLMKVKDSYNVNHLTQLVAEAAILDQAHMQANVARIRATRAAVAAELAALGFGVCPSQANFLFVRPPLAARDYLQGLREAGILIRYFAGPRTGAFVRITIGTDDEMAQLLAATRRLLASPR
jgi:histidinol-phosphate aminotransferase